MRLFLAVDLPENTKKYLAQKIELNKKAFSESLSGKLNFVNEKNYHITVKFLGDVDLANYQDLVNLIKYHCLGYSNLKIQLAKISIWPLKNPRIIKASIIKNKNLELITTNLSKAINNSKIIQPEFFDLKPAHITLARVKYSQTIKQPLSVDLNFKFSVFNLTLFQSELTPSGPIYTKLESFNLNK